MSLDQALWTAGLITETGLFLLLLHRRIYRRLPIFFLYTLETVLTDAVFMILRRDFPGTYFRIFLVNICLDTLLQFGVLVELGWSVLRPVRKQLPRGSALALTLLLIVAMAACWPLASFSLGAGLSAQWRLLLNLQQTFSILRILLFLVLAGFSQLLSLGWRDRELQVATGLGFYSVVALAVTIIHSHHHPYLHVLDQLTNLSYLLALLYWILCFSREETKREEFSPRMQAFLLRLAGAARLRRAAVETATFPDTPSQT